MKIKYKKLSLLNL